MTVHSEKPTENLSNIKDSDIAPEVPDMFIHENVLNMSDNNLSSNESLNENNEVVLDERISNILRSIHIDTPYAQIIKLTNSLNDIIESYQTDIVTSSAVIDKKTMNIIFDVYSDLFMRIFNDVKHDKEYLTENGEPEHLSVYLLNFMLIVIDIPYKQIDFILNLLISDDYKHIYTHILHGVISDILKISPSYDSESQWNNPANVLLRCKEIYAKYNDDYKKKQVFNNRLIRQDAVIIIIMMCTEEGETWLNEILRDENECDEIKIAIVNEMRDYLNFYQYSEEIKNCLYDDRPHYKNTATGFLMDYISVRRGEITDIINMGGEIALSLFNDIEQIINNLQAQIVVEHYRSFYKDSENYIMESDNSEK